MPLQFTTETYIDVAVAAGAAALMFGLMAFAHPRHTLVNRNGYMFLVLYGIYMFSLIIRGAA